MLERGFCCADRTKDINVRVGMRSPPEEGTGGGAEITDNELCGIFLGPGQTGSTSILTCDGEYPYPIFNNKKKEDCDCLLSIVKPRPKSQSPKAQPQPSQIQSKSISKGLGLTLKSSTTPPSPPHPTHPPL